MHALRTGECWRHRNTGSRPLGLIRIWRMGGLLLPGGHRARGMRSYIESDVLQRLVSEAFRRKIVVAAICHGVLLAARTVDPATGRSVLYGRKTTALTWELERRAWRISRVTRFWDPRLLPHLRREAG